MFGVFVTLCGGVLFLKKKEFKLNCQNDWLENKVIRTTWQPAAAVLQFHNVCQLSSFCFCGGNTGGYFTCFSKWGKTVALLQVSAVWTGHRNVGVHLNVHTCVNTCILTLLSARMLPVRATRYSRCLCELLIDVTWWETTRSGLSLPISDPAVSSWFPRLGRDVGPRILID